MNVSTIEPSWDARKKFLEYKRAVEQRHTEEDVVLMEGYRQLAKGRRILDINRVMFEAGVDHLQRPKLAIIRAPAKLCWFFYRGFSPIFSESSAFYEYKRRSYVQIADRTFPQLSWDRRNQVRLRAVVPTIPPSLRPAGDLSRYHILWEAEWETIPVDPMLLRHIRGPLYVVLATWDLTELERSILFGRR